MKFYQEIQNISETDKKEIQEQRKKHKKCKQNIWEEREYKIMKAFKYGTLLNQGKNANTNNTKTEIETQN